VKDSLVVCLDGNFQHRHHAKAGLAAPLVIPPIFLEPERVDHVRELITNLAEKDEPVSFSIVYPLLKIIPATYTPIAHPRLILARNHTRRQMTNDAKQPGKVVTIPV
jgi:hypothetical protein